jgi:hypothetical protein
MPVPPPTLPSMTAPPRAESIAANACSFRTWNPSMSLSDPSHVSATMGRAAMLPRRFVQSITAS